MKRHRRHAAIMLALAAGLATSWHPTPSLAAAPAPAHMPEGFGQARLPAATVRGPVRLAARRAWVWRIPESDGPDTIRVVLDIDVDTVLGTSRLTARRASFWIRPRRSTPDRVYEIFGYYSDVSSSDGPLLLTAKSLPVEAVIAATDPLRLKVDLRLPGPPDPGTPAADFV
ncbi:MAG TPA: hypothetical protein ENK11_09955, partial [Phycisphaerales bacterium]|nr:hypothetical protein [Phycisphaerales bacterium]